MGASPIGAGAPEHKRRPEPAPLTIRCDTEVVRPLLRLTARLAGERQGTLVQRLLSAELHRLSMERAP